MQYLWGTIKWISVKLGICVEALTRFSHVFNPNGLNNTLLSLNATSWNSCWYGTQRHNIRSKNRRWYKKLSIAQVQFMGKPAFLLMTFSNCMAGKSIFVPEYGFWSKETTCSEFLTQPRPLSGYSTIPCQSGQSLLIGPAWAWLLV